MDGCLPLACGSCDSGSVSKTEWDKYTDNIQNVLPDEKGRKYFKKFMIKCEMRHGLRVLKFWGHVDKVLNYRRSTENISDDSYYQEIEDLLNEADKIEGDDFDIVTLNSLSDALDLRDRDKVVEDLKLLKLQAARGMSREYESFKQHYTPRKVK